MKPIRMTLFMKLALLAFVVFSLITILQLRMEYNRLDKQGAELQARIDDARDNIEELNERLDEEFDDEYIERIARDQMNYCRPDEIVIYNDDRN